MIRQQVTVFNQRSVDEIFRFSGCGDGGTERTRAGHWRPCVRDYQLSKRPPLGCRGDRASFEEWDVPHISAIRWVSELMGIAGGDDCFPELSRESLGKNRIVADGASIVARNPDIIIGSWCGKKFRPEKVATRPGWEQVNAVRTKQLLKSSQLIFCSRALRR